MASTNVYEISRLALQELETSASVSITDVEPLASYNWIEAPKATPTIAVPGTPALWSVPALSRRLKKDSGLVYIAQNAARHPESPLEPLFRALYTTCPSFDIRSTDVVTDRNNIRKLLSFIDPSSARDGLEAFTISVEVTKTTAIFCRNETKTVDYIGPHEFKGFGHEFEKAYTNTQISGSTGHHRIISYRFDDLKFIVRHEVDGYVDTDMEPSSSKAKDHTEESLASMLGGLSISPAKTSLGSIPAGSKLVIKEEGQVVPLASTLEIKTRVLHKPLEIQQLAPQLWISQTPKLVRAYHQKGIFLTPVVEHVVAEIKSWEERKQKDLQKLAALIQKIIALVKKCEGKAVLKCDAAGDKRVVCKAETKAMLPKDLYSKWDDAQDHEAKAEHHDDGIKGSKIPQTMLEGASAANDTHKRPLPDIAK